MVFNDYGYREEKEDWFGLIAVVIVPVFLLVFGLSLIVSQLSGSQNPQNNTRIGVGGGPPMPSPSLSPLPTDSNGLPSTIYRDHQ